MSAALTDRDRFAVDLFCDARISVGAVVVCRDAAGVPWGAACATRDEAEALADTWHDARVYGRTRLRDLGRR